MTWSDPGVTMYALSSTGRIQSPEHRISLIAYTKDCVATATKRIKSALRTKSKTYGGDTMETLEQDVEDLEALLDYVTNAPLEEEAEVACGKA
jgi:hypothetical protein